VRVVRVTFGIDGRDLGSDTTSPYALAGGLNTASSSNGTHTLNARAVDAKGNTGTTAVTVTFNNVAALTAPTTPLARAEVLQRVSAIISQLITYLSDAKRTGARVDFNRVDFLIRNIVNLLNQVRVYQGR
jgi:hypothetical protein